MFRQQYFVNDPPQQHAKDTPQSLLHVYEPLHETLGATRSFPAQYASTSNSDNWRSNESQPRLPGTPTRATPESPRFTEDARAQHFTAQNRSTQLLSTTLEGASPLQNPQRQLLRSQEVLVQDPPFGQLPDSGHEDDAPTEERVKRSRRTNAKKPMPITGDLHDSEYMGFASDEDFRRNSNCTVNGLERAHIAPQLVLMYPKPGWEPKPPIDFKVDGKFGINLQEAHKAYLRDVVHIELDPLDQCIQVTDSKARGRLPVMIYIRVRTPRHEGLIGTTLMHMFCFSGQTMTISA